MTDKLIMYLQHQYSIIKEAIDDETVDEIIDAFFKTLNDDLVLNRDTIIDVYIDIDLECDKEHPYSRAFLSDFIRNYNNT